MSEADTLKQKIEEIQKQIELLEDEQLKLETELHAARMKELMSIKIIREDYATAIGSALGTIVLR